MSFDLWRDARECNPDHLSLALQSDRTHGSIVSIRMRPAIPARVGWGAGVKLTVHLGQGNDAGKIRLKQGTKFARALWIDRTTKYAAGLAPLILRVKAWPELGTVPHRAEKCTWRVAANDSQAIEIDLPEWAR